MDCLKSLYLFETYNEKYCCTPLIDMLACFISTKAMISCNRQWSGDTIICSWGDKSIWSAGIFCLVIYPYSILFILEHVYLSQYTINNSFCQQNSLMCTRFFGQSVIVMTGFRSLGEGEEVEFECKTSDKGLEATLVTGPEGSACVGSQRRPVAKKRFRKIRYETI